MKHKILLAALFVAALLGLVPMARVSAADHVVANCGSENELRAYLTAMQSSGGGTLTFNCGTVTITLTSQLPEIVTNTVIDGGGKITLSGGGSVPHFRVRPDAGLTLKNIDLQSGYRSDAPGGAILNEGYLTLNKVEVRNSSTPHDGGAIASYNRVEITDSWFSLNTSETGSGGAIYADDLTDSARVKITNTEFTGNTAANTMVGGAILSKAPMEIINSKFIGNKAGSGGAITARSLSGLSTIQDSQFQENSTTGDDPNANGGALLVDNTTLNIQSSFLSLNSGLVGGAIHVLTKGKLTVTDSTFYHNFSASGGGIFNRGNTTLTNVTVADHVVFSGGGGIENYGALSLTNVTLSKNQSSVAGGVLLGAGSTSLTNVTILENAGGDNGAGGILSTGVTTALFMKNVIVGNSTQGPNCLFEQAPTVSQSNLSSDNSCLFGTGRDGVNLKLDALGSNGGVTQTHVPLSGSPAIDGGADGDCPAQDQRGVKRPQGVRCDVGAVEVVPAPPTPTATATRTATPKPSATPTVKPCTGKPSEPMLLKPGNTKNVKQAKVKLNWQDASCVTKYKVIVRRGSSSGTIVQKKGGLTLSEFKTNPLTKGQAYAWRVVAINSAGKSKSAWWTFQVN